MVNLQVTGPTQIDIRPGGPVAQRSNLRIGKSACMGLCLSTYRPYLQAKSASFLFLDAR